MLPRPASVAGALLGCAAGDALGLPYENLSPRRAARLLGPPTRYRFLFGRGMVSDDTEHSCMALQALCDAPDDPERFARAFARRLRWWLVGVPAGAGPATVKATLRLWAGYSPTRSGVWSAGNGPAMRAGVLGAATDDLGQLKAFVRASTRVTHADPKAFEGAFAVALAARCSRGARADDFLHLLREQLGGELTGEFAALVALAVEHPPGELARRIGCERGVTGYVYHTVPVCLAAWLRHPTDFRAAVSSVIECGGDADTTAAIVGAIVGAGVGEAGIPPEWLTKLWEWPRTVGWMRRLAEAAATGGRPPRTVPLVGLARNGVFLAAVLAHAARRALPPY